MKHFLFLIMISLVSLSACDSQPEQQKAQPETTISTAESSTDTPDDDRKVIVFFGNSLTAGYGVEDGEAWPALIQEKIDSLALDYTSVNAGVSGETTAGGLARIEWILDRYSPDIFVLELGANDGLRGQSLEEAESNLQAILDKVIAANPDTKLVLAGMMIPPNYGRQYTDDFQAMYPRLAKANDLVLIPFLLDGVGGDPELNQEDGIHPTAKGHKVVAENVWGILKPLVMQKNMANP